MHTFSLIMWLVVWGLSLGVYIEGLYKECKRGKHCRRGFYIFAGSFWAVLLMAILA